MNAEQHSKKLVESGRSLRKLRTAFQVQLLQLVQEKAGKSYKARAQALECSQDAIRNLERRAKLEPIPATLVNSLLAIALILEQSVGFDYHKLLAAFDREITRAAVEAAGGKKGAAAAILGVHRNQVPVLLKRVSIKRYERVRVK